MKLLACTDQSLSRSSRTEGGEFISEESSVHFLSHAYFIFVSFVLKADLVSLNWCFSL